MDFITPLLMGAGGAGASFGLSKLFSSKPKMEGFDIGKAEQELDMSKMFGTPYLRDMVKQRLGGGPQQGFGKDFMDKTTSPLAKSMRQNWSDYERPQLESQLSKRGVARSAGGGLATDIMNRSYQSKERDIDDLMAKFTYLNNVEKQRQVSEGLGVAQNLNSAEQQMRMARAGLATDVPMRQFQTGLAGEQMGRQSEAGGAELGSQFMDALFGNKTADDPYMKKTDDAKPGSSDVKLAGALGKMSIDEIYEIINS